MNRLQALSGQLGPNQPAPLSIPQSYVVFIPLIASGAADLQWERKNAHFNVREMTYLLDGSPANTKV